MIRHGSKKVWRVYLSSCIDVSLLLYTYSRIDLKDLGMICID
jgi:hypothetical protein